MVGEEHPMDEEVAAEDEALVADMAGSDNEQLVKRNLNREKLNSHP
jgi:hypothetical protein